MKNIYFVLFGILGGLLGAALIWLTASQPRGEPVTLLPLPTPAPIIVHVEGAVVEPGVYALAVGSRARDALAAAGGLASDARPGAINLASRLEDGDQIWIPSKNAAAEVPFIAAPSEGAPMPGGAPSSAPPGKIIDINYASQPALETLPGIGPATALKIIAYREEQGPFDEIDDIMKVSGVGPATFERIRASIRVSTVINSR